MGMPYGGCHMGDVIFGIPVPVPVVCWGCHSEDAIFGMPYWGCHIGDAIYWGCHIGDAIPTSTEHYSTTTLLEECCVACSSIKPLQRSLQSLQRSLLAACNVQHASCAINQLTHQQTSRLTNTQRFIMFRRSGYCICTLV